jgi:hypothetical protein
MAMKRFAKKRAVTRPRPKKITRPAPRRKVVVVVTPPAKPGTTVIDVAVKNDEKAGR